MGWGRIQGPAGEGTLYHGQIQRCMGKGDVMGACQAPSHKEGAIPSNGGPSGKRARAAAGKEAVGGTHTPTSLSFHAGAFDWLNLTRRQETHGPSLGEGWEELGDWD